MAAAFLPYRNELIQHKQKNDELSSHLKKQKTRCHGVCLLFYLVDDINFNTRT